MRGMGGCRRVDGGEDKPGWRVRTWAGGGGSCRRRKWSRGFKGIQAFVDCWLFFFSILQTEVMISLWFEMLYFPDWMLKNTGISPSCVCICVYMCGFRSKSRMKSYGLYTPSNHQTNVNVPHNYIHVCKMIEKDKAFSSVAEFLRFPGGTVNCRVERITRKMKRYAELHFNRTF